MTSSAAPSTAGSSPDEPLLRRLMRATEIDTRMLGMIGALLLIWVGFMSIPSSHRRGPVHNARNLSTCWFRPPPWR